MPLVSIKLYDITITGQVTIQATNGGDALRLAKDAGAADTIKLNYAMTERQGYQWVEPPPPP